MSGHYVSPKMVLYMKRRWRVRGREHFKHSRLILGRSKNLRFVAIHGVRGDRATAVVVVMGRHRADGEISA